MRYLQASIAAAGNVQDELIREPDQDGLVSGTEELRKSIAKVTAELGGLSVSRGIGTGGQGAGEQ